MAITVAALGGVACGPALAQPPTSHTMPAAPATTPSATQMSRPTWADAVERAWQRSLEAADAQGQQRKAQAEQSAAASWVTGAPSLELSQRQGQGSAAKGERETEVGVVLPLWRWGQRDAAIGAGQAQARAAVSAERVARLHIATQVRDAAGALLTQEAQARQAAAHLALLQRLASDVDRRLAAGDLSPADAWAAKAEALAAEAQSAEQQRQLQSLRTQWLLLTGLAQAPEPPGAAAATVPADSGHGQDAALDLASHPELQLAIDTVALARRRVGLAQASRGGAPEVGVGLRDERPGQGAAAQRSLGVSLRLPLGTNPRSQPELAAALAEQDMALAGEQRTRARLVTEAELARLQQRSAQVQAGLERQRAALLRDRASHIHKSFEAGESALPDLLRALVAAAEADSASARQHIAAGIAQLRLQHALGHALGVAP
jgi:outer membrane protein, heavy metal efflux system